jgi:phosphatidylserine decarboxylase
VSQVSQFVEIGAPNPWIGATTEYFEEYFRTWFTYLPVPGGGLGKIIPFSFFYLNNPSAYVFLNTLKSRRTPDAPYTTEIFNWIVAFVKERGAFMDSTASGAHIDEWMEWLGPKTKDFIVPEGGYKTFNEFFTRALNPAADARPINTPDDPSIAVSPADAIVNFIISDLTLTQKFNVKSRQLNVTELLNGSKHAPRFEGGTAVSCVLMPENYHRYHAPVTGEIVEGVEVKGIYFGVVDGGNFLNKFNVGQGTTDFSYFEDFHRAYYIIETKDHGAVGVVPVGLNTISSMTASLICGESTLVPPGGMPLPVQKGEELGHFAYGGSLVILLFQTGVFPSVNVLMGSRLGSLGTVAGS